jgi:hypothetical protein
MAEPYDLYGFSFTGSASSSPRGSSSREGDTSPVCRDAAAVAAYYGTQNVIEDFGGVLDNAGEEIALSIPREPWSAASTTTTAPLPSGAKGTGHSLSILSPYRDPSNPASWRLSSERGGTPRRAELHDEPTFVDTWLVASGASWRYLKGTQQPSSPRPLRNPTFNDAPG